MGTLVMLLHGAGNTVRSNQSFFGSRKGRRQFYRAVMLLARGAFEGCRKRALFFAA